MKCRLSPRAPLSGGGTCQGCGVEDGMIEVERLWCWSNIDERGLPDQAVKVTTVR